MSRPQTLSPQNSFNIYIKRAAPSTLSEEGTPLPRLSSTNTVLLLTTGRLSTLLFLV
jgi:hypothetical protein